MENILTEHFAGGGDLDRASWDYKLRLEDFIGLFLDLTSTATENAAGNASFELEKIVS